MVLKNRCQELSQKKILVGILGKQNSDVLKIAHAHEYGSGKLPERSFIRASFDTNINEIETIVTKACIDVLNEKSSVTDACNRIGAQITQLNQNFIDENRVKPKSDFSKKKQYTTLYETGTHIRDRITFEVVNRK